MAKVQLESIKKSFGAVDVIKGVDIHIADGEFVALVGPSGCGKSTLLRMIAGLEDPSGGQISIGDTVVNDKLPKDRDIAMVFQSYALYPHMNVRRNISFSLELEKRSAQEIETAVKEVSEILALDDYLERLPKELSGGQRQRVAMGRAIVRNPSVFLFDEPLSNLDAKLRTSMRKEIKRLQNRLKTTSIYVTHDQTEAMTMADRIVVMRAGQVIQIGTPLELYNTPQNQFVAGFIGAPQMNLFNGTQKQVDGEWVIQVGQTLFPTPDGIETQADRAVVLGIRPEHLYLDDQNGFEVGVDVVEPMGGETHLTCVFEGEELRYIDKAETVISPNDTLRLGFETRRLHLFDAKTEQRL